VPHIAVRVLSIGYTVIGRWAPLTVLLLVAAALLAPRSGGAAESCAVPKRPSLCRAFAVLRRPAQAYDRLPRLVRHARPIRLTDPGGVRRLLTGHPKGYDLYVAAGHRLVCLVVYSRTDGSAGIGCNPPDVALRGDTYLEQACGRGARRHRVLVVELLPDGVSSVTIGRAGKPAVTRRVVHNVLVADLAVRATADVPRQLDWTRAGKSHQVTLGAGNDVVTCRVPR
jgi:hypothetical protein